ncbi:MAG: phosphatidate cytidylyltransferase [Actinobacteria bacterium]|nr:phosphatidate cytidylyltransferase [Actinomycetota bacterium]
MDERPEDQDQTTERVVAPAEGVRIIGAEEAADALERGDADPRLPEGAPRYGDRPSDPPRDQRPQARFPLSDPDGLDAVRAAGTAAPVLPPWTDPPTGEVPRVFADSRDESHSSSASSGDGDVEDDLDAWMGVTGAPRWRDHPNDWDEPDYLDLVAKEDDPLVASSEQPIGVRSDSVGGEIENARSSAQPDFFSAAFDPEPDLPTSTPHRAAAPRVARGVSTVPGRSGETGGRPSGGTGGRPSGGTGADRVVNGYATNDDRSGEADMRVRVITGLGMALVALVLFSMGPAMALAAVLVVLVAAAAEFYGMLRNGGYQPATLVGLVATASMVLAAYWKGTMALPLVVALTVVTTLVWYLMGVTGGAPTLNAGMTVLGVGYVGVLGSFAALILRFDNGVGILIGLILAVVANDVGALFTGRKFGRTPLAPHISPHKTREGLIGGSLGSIGASVLVLGMVGLHPWSISSALQLGLLVSVVAPLGDLCESMIKRDIGVKDAGHLLPGHGGVLDRFDALLFVLPAVYYLCLLIEVF